VWLIVVALSFVGIALILAWDWFFARRLPYVRWKASRLPPGAVKFLRELTRVRRLKDRPPGVRARGDGDPP
jgi:hypothetical protein